MNHLISDAHSLLNNKGFDYAICGGFAIELFINREIRTHGDIDISAYWEDRDKIIAFMQALGWQVYEMCGGGIAHRIANIAQQLKVKRNIFCFTDACDLVTLVPTSEKGMFHLKFDPKGQGRLNFIEFLFNHKTKKDFIYARDCEIMLPLSRAVLYKEGIPFLAPELVLLYKSTDFSREGYQVDFDSVTPKMERKQRQWLKDALRKTAAPTHPWLQALADGGT